MWLNLDPDEAAAIKELDTMSDRAAAIVGATIIDARLLELLKFKMLDLKIKENHFLYERMFSNSQALGAFSARINLGYMIRLYDETSWRDLNNIRDMRNHFAHKTSANSFNDRSIIDRCTNLKACDFAFQEPKPGETASTEIDDVAIDKFPKITFFLPGTDEWKRSARTRYLLCVRYYALLLKIPTVMQWGSRPEKPETAK